MKLSFTMSRKAQQGFTLLELALAFAIVGVGSVMVWQVMGLNANDKVQMASRDALKRSAFAVERYAQLHGNLPCPAVDSLGVADCTTGSAGFVPYQTIGLPLPEAGALPYRVDVSDPNITVPTQRYEVVTVASTIYPIEPVITNVPLRTMTPATVGELADLCTALSDSSALTRIAYQVMQNPLELVGMDIDPLVIQASRGQLLGKFSCSSLAAGGRGHFNVLSAALFMRQSIADYVKIYNTSYDINFHTLAQATLTTTELGLMAARTIPYTLLATMAFIDSLGTNALAIKAMADVPLETVLLLTQFGAALSDEVRIGDIMADWRKRQNRLLSLQLTVNTMVPEIQERAIHSAAHSVFGLQ